MRGAPCYLPVAGPSTRLAEVSFYEAVIDFGIRCISKNVLSFILKVYNCPIRNNGYPSLLSVVYDAEVVTTSYFLLEVSF